MFGKKKKPVINNEEYGAFIVSNNVVKGKPILYSYREESSIPQCNGWTIYSCDDSQEYIENPDNFVPVNASSIYKIAPVMLELFDAPYGTDLCWIYEGNTHVGFYDLAGDKNITINEILNKTEP